MAFLMVPDECDAFADQMTAGRGLFLRIDTGN
jgi:hypothetical protein